MQFVFRGPIIYWRGPAPWYFVQVPLQESANIRSIAGFVTYGWGVLPATIQIGATTWTTSLIPKDGYYLVPLRVAIRKAEQLNEGDLVQVELTLGRS